MPSRSRRRLNARRRRQVVEQDELPPSLESNPWTLDEYRHLEDALKIEVLRLNKEPICFSEFPRNIGGFIHGPLKEAVSNPQKMVIITRYHPCEIMCNIYSTGNHIRYEPSVIRAFVIWGEYFKPICRLEDGTLMMNIGVWYNKITSDTTTCVVCFEDDKPSRWCGTCGEHTCLECYQNIRREKRFVKCPHCRKYFDYMGV